MAGFDHCFDGASSAGSSTVQPSEGRRIGLERTAARCIVCVPSVPLSSVRRISRIRDACDNRRRISGAQMIYVGILHMFCLLVFLDLIDRAPTVGDLESSVGN